MELYNSGFSSYNTAYNTETASLSDSEKYQEALAKGINIKNYGILPPCHINFNALDINLTMFDLKPEALNLKLFKKIDHLGKAIIDINSRFISIIEELHCCNIAESYNDNILPIFEYILDTFVKELVSIAEDIIREYQTFALVLCAIRPVPGNPWMKGAGFDFFETFYSIIYGLDEIIKWVVNGNVIDILLDPVKKFDDKLASCFPNSKDAQEINDLINLDITKVSNDSVLNNNFYKWQTSVIKNIEDDKSKKGCGCLFSILDFFNFNLPETVTIHSSQDLSKLDGSVLWKEKTEYVKALNSVKDSNTSDNSIENIIQLKDFILSDSNYTSKLLLCVDKNINYTDRYNLRKYDVLYTSYINSTFYVPLRSLKISKYISKNELEFEISSDNITVIGESITFLNADLNIMNRIQLNHNYFKSQLQECNNVTELLLLNDKRISLKSDIIKAKNKLITKTNLFEKKLNSIYNLIRRKLIADIKNSNKILNSFKLTENPDLILKKIGLHFDPYTFIDIYLSDTYGNIIKELIAKVSKESNYSFTNTEISDYIYDSNTIDFLIASTDRLDKLIIYDNWEIEIIGKNELECGCDIVCKLIQMLVDMILSAISEIINTIIKNIINVCLNEKISYIIKFILDKYQCFLNATVIQKNKKNIKKLAEALKDKYELKERGEVDKYGNPVETIPNLKRMVDINCNSIEEDNDVADLLKTIPNEIPIVISDTVYGAEDLSSDLTDIPGSIVPPNFGYSNVQEGDKIKGRNIPELCLYCNDNNFSDPSITIYRKTKG